jgi:outer membrane receptor for ferrienterochelin and colicins
MLGLSGIYKQMTNENLQGTRGLVANYGMGYIPGPWIEVSSLLQERDQ